MYKFLSCIRELGAVPVTRIETAGGGAKNEVWCRMRERLTGVPVSAAEWTEAYVYVCYYIYIYIYICIVCVTIHK